MDTVLGYAISFLLGIISGVFATVLYDKLCVEKKKREVAAIKKELVPIDIFAEYVKSREVIPIVSFEDSNAITIEPLFQSGIYVLKASINIENKPKTRDNKNFVMALLKYIPELNWRYYCECGYSLKFKIRGNIKGLQLEVKNDKMRKVLDEYISITEFFEENTFRLKGDGSIWESIEEICFTVFCEGKYISGTNGRFEIMDCRLEK